jgi:S1-C subfamily serine protease
MIPPTGLAVMTKHLAANIARVAAAMLLTCGVALAEAAPDTAAQNTAKLTTVLMTMPAGTVWLSMRLGLTCTLDSAVMRASGGREPQNLPLYVSAFKTELERAGFKALADDDLFNREPASADYQVAAVITDAHIVACVSTGGLLHAGKEGDARGTGSMKVDWQVYSPVRKEVVAHVSTSGTMTLDKTVPDGTRQLVGGVFASNVRELTASPEFRDAMNAKPLATSDVLLPEKQGKIALSGSQKAVKRPVADAVGSVVTLLTGSGSGSGVLLSDDGYILTNAHVVGEEKEIRVRWSDGIEKAGQIIRVAKARDVALVKTDPRGRPPLAIVGGPVTPGQRVYAIGSPNGATFGGTVSSGVVSASRTINGFSFIQSDVSVSPGSSGGALLNETGSLLGITEGGFDNDGRPAGLNIFIPIGDAMDFLSLEQN